MVFFVIRVEVGGFWLCWQWKRSFLYSFLGGLSCVWGVVVSLVVLAVEWSYLCGSL